MRWPEKHRIRIGTLVPGNRNTADYIRNILPHGFESFAINFGNSVTDIDLSGLAGEINRVLEGADAVISAVGVYGNPLGDTVENKATLESWDILIENAHLFGTDIVTGFSGRIPGKSIPECIPAFRDAFTPLAEKAHEKGVRIAFENCSMGGDWNAGDMNIAHGPDAWELMFEAVPLDNLGLEWEPCHQMVQLIDPIPQLRKWVNRIFHLHGKDATIRWDDLKTRGILGKEYFALHRTPGFGDCNWSDVITELRRGGFTGSIDIEGWHDPVYKDDLEMTGQVHALHYLKQCRGGDFIPNP